MNDSKISVRYAKAFYTLCTEENIVDRAKADMLLILQTCQIPEMKWLLSSPVLKVSDKINAFKALFSNQINAKTMAFLLLIAENKRDAYIPMIARNFIVLYNTSKGIMQAKLTTAVEIDPKVVTVLQEFIRENLKTIVELEYEINPEIIGGFILRIDDLQIDAGVKSRLNKIKRELFSNSSERKI